MERNEKRERGKRKFKKTCTNLDKKNIDVGIGEHTKYQQ